MLEGKLTTPNLPRGIVPLLETTFLENGSIDYDSLHKPVEHSINGGANGLTAPLVASEVQALSILEREQLVKAVAHIDPNCQITCWQWHGRILEIPRLQTILKLCA